MRWLAAWLCRCCIDQSNIDDGLRVLPVNVMACRQTGFAQLSSNSVQEIMDLGLRFQDGVLRYKCTSKTLYAPKTKS